MTWRKASGVAGNGDGGAVRCCGCCGWAKEETESEMRARGGSGECGACCSVLWPDVATLGRTPATRGVVSAPRGARAL